MRPSSHGVSALFRVLSAVLVGRRWLTATRPDLRSVFADFPALPVSPCEGHDTYSLELRLTFRVSQATPHPDPFDAAGRRWPHGRILSWSFVPYSTTQTSLLFIPGLPPPGYAPLAGFHTLSATACSTRPPGHISDQSAHGVHHLSVLSLPKSRNASSASCCPLVVS